MANLIIENTGADHLYPDGVPVFEVKITISELYKKIARVTSLAVQADPYFQKMTNAQRIFSELHGDGDRITEDFLEDGAEEILPVFSAFQRWMTDDPKKFEFDINGEIIYRWLNTDTRLADQKLNYTAQTGDDLRFDTQKTDNVKKYLKDALINYVLRELYRTIGYGAKYEEYKKLYENYRSYVAFWVKSERGSQTQYHHAGV